MNDFEKSLIAYMVYRDRARLVIPMSPCATGISRRVEADKAGDLSACGSPAQAGLSACGSPAQAGKPLPYMGVCFCAFCLRVLRVSV